MNRLLSTLTVLLLFTVGFGWSTATAQDMGNPPENDGPTVVDVAIESDDFNILVEALQVTGLDAALQGEGPFTILAPNDEAFEALGDDLERLMEEENIEELANILSYHVVTAEAYAEDIAEMTDAPTVTGQSVGISAEDDVITLSGSNSAEVVQADIEASNGVIHVIDTVLLPPGE
ncbi:MAG: fasciclin domain-containing protein [Longimonas sp.]|uniref:fasciclin domain-containing protein n=1 Tax=Longimonas sp. TaxID=2039626 RepID=UPI0039755839